MPPIYAIMFCDYLIDEKSVMIFRLLTPLHKQTFFEFSYYFQGYQPSFHILFCGKRGQFQQVWISHLGKRRISSSESVQKSLTLIDTVVC